MHFVTLPRSLSALHALIFFVFFFFSFLFLFLSCTLFYFLFFNSQFWNCKHELNSLTLMLFNICEYGVISTFYFLVQKFEISLLCKIVLPQYLSHQVAWQNTITTRRKPTKACWIHKETLWRSLDPQGSSLSTSNKEIWIIILKFTH